MFVVFNSAPSCVVQHYTINKYILTVDSRHSALHITHHHYGSVDQVVLVRIKIPGAVGGGETAGAARRIVILNNNLLHTESVCIDNHRYGLPVLIVHNDDNTP